MKDIIYTLGLDIGINSVGWAVVENEIIDKDLLPKRLLKTGVRVFETAEKPKTGESLAKDRRLSRSTRRLLRRRASKKHQIKRLLIKIGLIKNEGELALNLDVYKARSEALDIKIENVELAKAILHICKKRGFKSSRKKLDDKEGGDYKPFITGNLALMAEKNYRTVGEMLYKDEKFKDRKRNKDKNYHSFATRQMLREEFELILKTQKDLGNNLINDDFIKRVLAIFDHQLPYAKGDQIKKMVGKCTFEPDQMRAPKNSISFEDFSLLQKFKNINIYNQGSFRNKFTLTDEQVKQIFDSRYERGAKTTYKTIRKILELSNNVLFSDLRYKYYKPKLKDGKEVDPEEDKVYELKGYPAFLKVFKKSPELWGKIKADYKTLDQIVESLTLYKIDGDIKADLIKKGIEAEIIEKVLEMPTFDKFGHLSLKAVYKILPLMQDGKNYTDACMELYPEQFKKNYAKKNRLPPVPTDQIRNPIVIRATTQVRKVINAIVSKYGQPTLINIEMARDMSRTHRERMDFQKIQEGNRQLNEEAIKELTSIKNSPAIGLDITKYRLWKEQGLVCAYTQKGIRLEDLVEPNLLQIDHILPQSRSFDDSMSNKVLVFASENQNKGNMTPLEYIRSRYGETSEQERTFREYVKSAHGLSSSKKAKLLNEDLPQAFVEADEWLSRDLNDTRYVTRLIKNYIEENLALQELPKELERKRQIFTFQGYFTSQMRNAYRLIKVREETNRHHAMDAIILAVSNSAMLQQLSKIYKKEKEGVKKEDRRFAQPWQDFRHDIYDRVYSDELKIYQENENLKNLYADMQDEIKPLFVSRMPTRKVTGKANGPNPLKLKEATKKSGRFIDEKTFVDNGSMACLDVYLKDERYYFVPVYVADLAKTQRPNKAIASGKPESEWTVMTQEYKFIFSIHPNDYLEIETKKEKVEGYYVSMHRKNGSMILVRHDGPKKDHPFVIDKGVLTAKAMRKYFIDIFGQKHEIKQEKPSWPTATST